MKNNILMADRPIHGFGKPFREEDIKGSKALSHMYWKPCDLHFWASLMETKKHFIRSGSISIKDGSENLIVGG
jgi:hypothetical protein